MFGVKRKKPLELVPFAVAKPLTFNALLCDGVTAHNIPSFADLLVLHARLQQERADQCVLASLDDLGQACYTSGHGTDSYGLDDIEDHDLSGLGEEVFEGGEHIGYLSTPAEFPIRLANLAKLTQAVELGQVAGLLEWETPGDANDLVTVNRDPEGALRIAEEKEVIFQFVPVAFPADAIAAFPNGYFRSDLNPMQNHALARHLEAKYGLGLFGIGSRFLGFRRSEALREDVAQALATELAIFYAGTTRAAADELERLITGRDWLLLRYTES
jgi:hypothetical protein